MNNEMAEEFKKLYKAKTDLYEYWKLLAVEDERMGYSTSNHIEILAEHAQRFAEGKIKRLMVVMPPRHGKSTMMSHFMPAWFISNNPEKSVMLLCYNDDFASEQGSKSRVLFDHPQHKRIFGNQKFSIDRYGTFSIGKSDGSPNFMSGGAGTAITGRGADRIVIDDPVKDEMEARSTARKLALVEWYKKVVVTRLVPGGGICLCMTRWTYDDLAGSLLEENKDEWTVLHLPAIDKNGKALWEVRYSIEELNKIRKEIGERAFQAMYQGQPAPEEGALFNRSWFDVIDKVPIDWKEKSRIRFWDMAATKGGDYCTGSMVVLYDNGHVVVHDLFHEQVTPYEAQKAVIDTAKRDKCPIGIEEEGGSASKILMDFFKRELMKYGVRTVKPRKGENKEVRSSPFAIACENGMVHIKKSERWNEDFLTEFCQFPLGKHDDIVDATSYAFNMLTGNRRVNRACVV